MEKVPFLDLKAQYETIREEIRAAVERVLETQGYILGPEVEELEKEIAAYCRCRYAIGVSSGTDALLLALTALDVRPGDEIITTPYSFFATAGCIHRLGARPVFVDIDPDTYNMRAELIHEAVTDKTRAILPVHLYGQCAGMDEIAAAARERGLAVIEDAAQAIGAEYKDRRAGTLGDVGCFSFYPTKNLGGIGDGGMVTCGDESVAKKMRVLRVHGMEPKYYHSYVGGNFRMDALQAAALRVKLKYLDRWTAERQENARIYNDLFQAAGLVGEKIVLPAMRRTRHVFNQYVVRVSRRDELKAFLQEKGIGTDIYYPVPLHLQECFAYLGYKEGDFPASEEAARSTLALPVYPELSRRQCEYVVEQIAGFYK